MKKLIARAAEKKLAAFTTSLDDEIKIVRRLFLLELIVAFLGGIILGMLFSPRKTTQLTVASGNKIGTEPAAGSDGEEENEDI